MSKNRSGLRLSTYGDGLAANFNPSLPYSFVLAAAAGGITGFSADVFRVDTSDFENNFAGGSFNIVQSGSDLLLNFTPGLPGDYNDDGMVDAADYVVWRENEGTMNPLPNDPIGGTIDADQYNQWRSHFGQSGGSGASASANTTVPEPTTAMFMLIMGLLAIRSNRRITVSNS